MRLAEHYMAGSKVRARLRVFVGGVCEHRNGAIVLTVTHV